MDEEVRRWVGCASALDGLGKLDVCVGGKGVDGFPGRGCLGRLGPCSQNMRAAGTMIGSTVSQTSLRRQSTEIH